ncbi:MAG: alpha-hydroxy-acid oxidizing protein, partial [Rhodospirillales bacterium]|nr:alpha-hydroxy-acid oxidizing protein [Rhodospirillales bacterium]
MQGRLWFQLYMWVERQLSYDLIRRADDAGYEALVVTVDTPLSPLREYNDRNGFSVPYAPTVRNVWDMLLRPGWLTGTMLRYVMREGMPALQNHPTEFNRRATRAANAPRVTIDASLDFDEIARLRDRWPRKLIVKGILHPQDALEAVARGADAIIVSTHGGRNFDCALPSFDALPAIVAAVGDKATIIVDSGIRRGADILKAVALGAHAVQVGRATLFGTTVAGKAGAARALEL